MRWRSTFVRQSRDIVTHCDIVTTVRHPRDFSVRLFVNHHHHHDKHSIDDDLRRSKEYLVVIRNALDLHHYRYHFRSYPATSLLFRSVVFVPLPTLNPLRT
jgi:hypothetical protein